MSRVLVCGGRAYADGEHLGNVMDEHVRWGDTVVTGGAGYTDPDGTMYGADLMAHTYATKYCIKAEVFFADWKTHGKAAGPIRNREMLASGIDLVIAFPGGRGTADCVRQAEERGIRVIRV